MKRHAKLTVVGSALACGSVLPPAALAGGLSLYEIATPDVGLAAAGYAARADDASTVFKNPAGMSRLTTPQLQAGAQLLYGDVTFAPDENTSTGLGTGDGGNAIGVLPAASLFYVHPLGEKWALGVGTFSYFGLMQRYDEDWVGRYFMQEGAMLGVSFMPSLSFKATDWLSIGAGLNAMYGYLDTQVAVNNVDPRIGDGQLKLKDGVWGFGANVGVLIEPRAGTRLGLTYLSAVDLDFSDTPEFSNLGPGLGALLANPSELNLGVTVPQSVMFSIYQDVGERWALLANAGWQNWNQFGKVDVGVDSATSAGLTTNLHYQDTWHGALGAQFHASEDWLLTGGVAYDSSAVGDEDRTVSTPMGEAWRVGVGARWQISPAVNLGAAYEFLWAGDMSVDQGSESGLRGRVSGAFEDAWFSFFTLNLDWKF